MKIFRPSPVTNLGAATHQGMVENQVLQETQDLLSKLESINRVQAQAPARVIAITTLLVAVFVGLLTVHSLTSYFAGETLVAAPWVPLLSTVVLAAISAFFWIEKQVSIFTGKLLVVFATCVFLLGMFFNGLLTVYAVPGLILLLYIFGPPTIALVASIIVIAFSSYVALLAPGGMELAVFMRVLVAALIAVTVLQMLVRQRRRLVDGAYGVTERLQQLVSSLQKDLKLAELERDRATTIDTQTGLLNAKAFEAALAAALAARSNENFAGVVILRFEHVEEFLATLEIGEQTIFIDALVSRLRDAFQPSPLGRRGKWEFAGLLDLQTSSKDLRKVLSERLARLSQPVTIGVKSLPVFPRVGVSCWPFNGENARSALRNAEIALVVAADSHRAEPIWFDRRMENAVFGRAAMAQSFDRAMEQNEFELVYQPIIQINGKSLHKVEALIRWNDPVKGRISPADFIPLAESYGKIVPLTRWVMTHAVQQVLAWRKNIDPNFQISVNMPPAFLEWFADRRSDALAWLTALGSPDKGVVLEITEGAFLNVTQEILDVLAILKNMGFEIALDDFGVGYSCFAQLDRLPLDSLKIDKSLVDHIETTPSKRTVCNTIIKMGHELGFKVVAEGVETQGQADMLADAKIDFIQGYVFAKPMSVKDLEGFAARWQASPVAL